MLRSKKGTRRVLYGLGPTKERYSQNGGVAFEDINVEPFMTMLERRYRAVWESPLDAYLDKGFITKEEHRAGMKFRRAHYGAIGAPRGIEQDGGLVGGGDVISELDRVLKAAFKKMSLENIDTLVDVCRDNTPISDPAKFKYLKSGLGELAQLWSKAAFEVCLRKR